MVHLSALRHFSLKFTQYMYILNTLTTNSLIPTVYALLPNKSQKTYVHPLNQLKKFISTLSPKLIMSDFEIASVNAFKEVFPNLKQKGCHFHFSQCVWRKI